MYILSAACISPQDTFASNGMFPPVRILEGNRWSCREPDYKTYISDAALRRRMSRIIRMGVATALHCVDLSGVEPDSIITATGLGCLTDTEKFLAALIENEQLLNPTPFIQSTFNTVGAQAALILGNHGYNNTYVHRGVSFESALLDAMMQLKEDADTVLAGCFDETTSTGFEVMRRLGFWKDDLIDSDHLYPGQTKGTASGEGAAFFMLGSQPVEKQNSIHVSGIHFFNTSAGNLSIGHQITDFLTSVKRKTDDLDLLVLGNNGDYSDDETYRGLISRNFADKPYCLYKNLCGEYATASGFALYLAYRILTRQYVPDGVVSRGLIPQKINHILIYNHYRNINHSLILLEKINN